MNASNGSSQITVSGLCDMAGNDQLNKNQLFTHNPKSKDEGKSAAVHRQ